MLGDSMMLGGGRKAAYSIENSLLFSGAQYLKRTPTVNGDGQKFTVRMLVRRGTLGTLQRLLMAFRDNSDTGWLSVELLANDRLSVMGWTWQISTVSAWRDPTAWLDICIAVDSAQAMAQNRCVISINGVTQATTNTIGSGVPLGVATPMNQAGAVHHLFCNSIETENFNGYSAETILVDGAVLTPSHFGETDPVTGSWRPKAIAGVPWGTNGCYLGKPWKAASLGTDYSGRGNDWTATGFAANDVRNDSPTNVYTTLNRLYFQSSGASGPYSPSQMPVFSDGNGSFSLGASPSSWANPTGVVSTHAILPGTRVYFECAVLKPSYFLLACGIGTSADVTKPTAGTHQNRASAGWTQTSVGLLQARDTGGDRGAVYANAVAVPGWEAVGSSISTVQVAVDLVNNRLWIGQGGTWLNGSNPDVLESGIPLTGGLVYFPWFTLSTYSSGENGLTTNFGQKPFVYAVPTGFNPLCSANSPATTGQPSGSFIGNGSADGPCIYTGAVPLTLSINGNPVTWGTHADRLATGFKIRTSSASYNVSGSNTWTATYDRKPTVGPKGRAPANAQAN